MPSKKKPLSPAALAKRRSQASKKGWRTRKQRAQLRKLSSELLNAQNEAQRKNISGDKRKKAEKKAAKLKRGLQGFINDALEVAKFFNDKRLTHFTQKEFRQLHDADKHGGFHSVATKIAKKWGVVVKVVYETWLYP